MTEHNPSTLESLQARVRYLEEVNRMALDALDRSASLGDFQASISELHSPNQILDLTRRRIMSLMELDASAFFLVDEESGEFVMRDVHPDSASKRIQAEVEHAIDSGVFAWALREKRPIFISMVTCSQKLLLHSMSTESRDRGMFVGALDRGEMDVPLISLSLLSIVLLHSANALESFELYHMIKSINEQLEARVIDRTRKLSDRLAIEDQLSRIARGFISVPQHRIGDSIRDALETVAELTRAHKHFLLLCDAARHLLRPSSEDRVSRSESHAPYRMIEARTFSFFHELVSGNRPRLIPALESMPSQATRERLLFGWLGIESAWVVPLIRSDSLIGYFGFGYRRGQEPPDEMEGLLSILGETFSGALRRLEMERELLHNQARLRHSQKMEALGRMAGGIAHDFNNVLSAIMVNAELGLIETGETHGASDRFREIQRAVERVSQMTRQLLAVSRRQVIELRRMDLNRLTRDLQSVLQRLVGDELGLEVHLIDEPLLIRADPGQIRQIVINLVENAHDAIRESKACAANKVIRVETSTMRLTDPGMAQEIGVTPGNYALIRVVDQGVGMDEETCSRIFEPFFTTKENGRGSGLGLATVYGIVDQNQGAINVSSKPGEGSAFSVFWPLEPVSDQAESVALEPREAVAAGKETVFVVEDDAALRDALEKGLLTAGYKVLGASNGREAMEKLRQNDQHVHLLLSDVMMPEMNGIDLADALRKRFPGLKVLFATGYIDAHLSVEASSSGLTRVIQKPYTIKQITSEIRELLGN